MKVHRLDTNSRQYIGFVRLFSDKRNKIVHYTANKVHIYCIGGIPAHAQKHRRIDLLQIAEVFVGCIRSLQETEVGSHYHFGEGGIGPEVTDKTSKGCPEMTRTDFMKVRSGLKWFCLPPPSSGRRLARCYFSSTRTPPIFFLYSQMGYSKLREAF